jgi:hypothetical protein
VCSKKVFRQILLDVLTLLDYLCDLINRLKSSLEMSSKINELIEELFRHEAWLKDVHV